MSEIVVLTQHPVAIDSPDHIDAAHSGAGNDNSRNPNFNARLLAMFGESSPSVLDLGCAGGGFVKSLLDDGCLAVGLEGSDYCQRLGKFEWAALGGKNLFTADITRPFEVQGQQGKRVLFDLVTCWEVMEHIPEAGLSQLIANVLAHLKVGGFWLMSVSEQVDGHFHQTVHPMQWWVELFARHGLRHDPSLRARFDGTFVRGPEQTPWAIVAPNSFHLALVREDSHVRSLGQ